MLSFNSFSALSIKVVVHTSNPLFFLKCLLKLPLPFHSQTSHSTSWLQKWVSNRALNTSFSATHHSPDHLQIPPADSSSLNSIQIMVFFLLNSSFVNIPFNNSKRETFQRETLDHFKRWVCLIKAWNSRAQPASGLISISKCLKRMERSYWSGFISSYKKFTLAHLGDNFTERQQDLSLARENNNQGQGSSWQIWGGW